MTTFHFQTHRVAFTPRLLSPHGHYRISNTVFCFLALGSSRCCWRSPNAPPLLIPVTSVPEPWSEFIYRGRDTGEHCSGHPVNSRGITLLKHVGELTQITAHRTPTKRPRNHHKDSPQHQGSSVTERITGTRLRDALTLCCSHLSFLKSLRVKLYQGQSVQQVALNEPSIRKHSRNITQRQTFTGHQIKVIYQNPARHGNHCQCKSPESAWQCQTVISARPSL